ncbi:MAG: hypothetical protein AAGH17_04175 [Pseudomonadota bacterium]
MAIRPRAAAPACFCDPSLPDTLGALRQTSDVTDIGHSIEPLALVGTLLDNALITTQSSAALISSFGGYGALQPSNGPLRLSRKGHRADIRFAASSQVRVTRNRHGVGSPAPISLTVLDAAGHVRHRVQVRTAADQMAVMSLEPSAPTHPGHSSELGSNVIPLAAIRAAKADWTQQDAGRHLNDFLDRDGATRLKCLPHMGRNRAWRVQASILPSFLTFLRDRRVGCARFVPTSGLMHMDVGTFDDVSELDDVIVTKSGRNTFSMDMKSIASAWVTALGPVWQIELYDADGRAVAVIGADPHANTTIWRDMLSALPPARGAV